MNQAQFIKAHEQQWLILEVLLNSRLKKVLLQQAASERSLSGKKHLTFWQKKQTKKNHAYLQSLNNEKLTSLKPKLLIQADFPALYRNVCQHLSLAQSRRYSPYLIERLSFLVNEAHQRFYQKNNRRGSSVLASFIHFFSNSFPQIVRSESRWLWLSSAVFYLPLILMIVLIQIWPEFVYSVMSPDSVAGMEAMYDPQAEHIGRERGSESDARMFGFYILNNTGIGFRTFATGLLFGIGSIFTLLFNGLHIGAAAGHLTQIGYGNTFWPFVSGHSALELSAIALSGSAGLKIGFSLLMPGRKSRYQALLDAASVAVKIMAGAAVMFFMAAFVEAFWSSSQTIAPLIKYAVGALMWLLVFAYFAFAGQKTVEQKSGKKKANFMKLEE